MRLFITGGAGFIGSNFIHYWVQRHPEDEIVNFDLLTYAGNLENLQDLKDNPKYRFIQGDIRDASAVESSMRGCDLVVHFAAESHVDRSILEPSAFVTTNVVGTHILLEAARKFNLQRFHHISTDEVFGTLTLGDPSKFSETTPYCPRSPYAATKAASDHLVRAYAETYGLPVTITNCSNNYGPYQFPEKLVSLAITNILEEKKVPVYTPGNQVRDWLYVEDHCRAIAAVLERGRVGETYCIGGLTEDVTNMQLIQLIVRLMGKSEDVIEMVQDRPGHDVRYAMDWSKIHHDLGWSPSVTLEEGIKRTIQWYQYRIDWWKPLKDTAQFAQYYQVQYVHSNGSSAEIG